MKNIINELLTVFFVLIIFVIITGCGDNRRSSINSVNSANGDMIYKARLESVFNTYIISGKISEMEKNIDLEKGIMSATDEHYKLVKCVFEWDVYLLSTGLRQKFKNDLNISDLSNGDISRLKNIKKYYKSYTSINIDTYGIDKIIDGKYSEINDPHCDCSHNDHAR